ncbi:MAG: hypothetical protein K8T89_09365 [Planctomycetes bacterium]|nr:hypothetical protein [Planctomycetota bacterium]
MAIAIVGGILLVGGLVGLALEGYFYIGGHYQDSAEVSVRASNFNAGLQPDAQRDSAKVAERVRRKLTAGAFIAGIPTVIGIVLLLLYRKKSRIATDSAH